MRPASPPICPVLSSRSAGARSASLGDCVVNRNTPSIRAIRAKLFLKVGSNFANALEGHQRSALSLSRTSQEADEEKTQYARVDAASWHSRLLAPSASCAVRNWGAQAEEQATTADARGPSTDVPCCKAGDMTPPTELVKKVPKGQLHSPYPDYAKLAKEEDLVEQFRLPGCNECHGGTGGGGICPALT